MDLLLDEAGVAELIQGHLVILVDLHLLEHPFRDVLHVVSRHALHVVKCREDLQHLGHSDGAFRINFARNKNDRGSPEPSPSYISNNHFNFSPAVPEVGMSVAIRNSFEIEYKSSKRIIFHTLKSMLPLLSSSKRPKSWSTKTRAMPDGRRRQ